MFFSTSLFTCFPSVRPSCLHFRTYWLWRLGLSNQVGSTTDHLTSNKSYQGTKFHFKGCLGTLKKGSCRFSFGSWDDFLGRLYFVGERGDNKLGQSKIISASFVSDESLPSSLSLFKRNSLKKRDGWFNVLASDGWVVKHLWNAGCVTTLCSGQR